MGDDLDRTVTRQLSQQRSANNSRRNSLSEASNHEEVNNEKVWKDQVWSDFEEQTNAIETIQSLLSALTPATDIEIALVRAVKFLVNSHMKLRSDHKILAAKVDSVNKVSDSNTVASAQALQYTRRDTVIVTGLPYSTGEKPEALQTSVATVLSSSGVTVTGDDFSAYHRNSKTPKTKTITDKKTGIKKDIVIPPSITVRFRNSNVKDTVLRNYKNYDQSNRTPKKVRVYQSLTPYYSLLKSRITENARGFGDPAKEVKWVHWRSPSSGLAVKLKDESFYQGIHSMDDFWSQVEN